MTARPDFTVVPGVDRVLADASIARLCAHVDRETVTGLVRDGVNALRRAVAEGGFPAGSDALAFVRQEVEKRLAALLDPRLRPVVNATGVILHTNLGRAPLPAEAVEAIAQTAGGYVNLEVDLDSGDRGSRTELVEDLICRFTGAEAAAVVNNNAAAVLLALNTLALGREAVVSRGQLVEIGGSFRIPEIMARSGARMVEIGTTNRTHLRDYAEAVNAETGLLLVVHPSNFEVQGFTASVALEDVVGVGRDKGIPVVHDLGSGALIDLSPWGLGKEPLVSASVGAGADVTTFSGDKVLGGPQAGILVGKREAIAAIRMNPLMRALRCGRLTYAALEATLRLYLAPESLPQTHPVLRMLTEPAEVVLKRAQRLAASLAESGIATNVVGSVGRVGSGALPLEEIESWAVELSVAGMSASRTARALRKGTPSVVGYVRDERVVLDARTVADAEVAGVVEAVRRAASGAARCDT